MISIISAVRGRYDLTWDSFMSIWNNCSDKNNVEHIVASDEDDYKMHDLLIQYNSFCLDNNFAFRHHGLKWKNKKEYSLRSMHKHYWNPLARVSKGDIIFGLCNDTIIITKDYDKILESAVKENIKKYNHEYFQIFIDDGWTEKHNYCSWIILTRPCLEIFDGIAPSEISSQGADQFVANVFRSTGIKSIIDLRQEIHTKQISVQTGTYESDDVQENRPIQDNQRNSWPFFYDILFVKRYYHYKLNYNILNSILSKDKSKWKK